MKNIFIGTFWFYVLRLISCNETVSETSTTKHCMISVPDLYLNHPLFTKPNSAEMIYPNKKRLRIFVEPGESIEFHCPGSKLLLNGSIPEGPSIGRCVNGDTFDISGTLYNISSIVCEDIIKSTTIRTSYRCLPSGVYIKVGFQLSGNRFINQYTVCFEFKRKTTFNSYHSLIHAAESSNISVSGIFKLSSLFQVNLDHLYGIESQKQAINFRTGLSPDNTKYINEETHLNKLMLAPFEDFVYGFEREAAYRYLNVIPQWNNLHTGNWYFIESITRDYAKRNGVDLDIYTGTYGITQLYNEQVGISKQVFLFYERAFLAVPIPFIIWKVVYDPVNKKGVAFLALNNPYFQRPVDYCFICPDISFKFGNVWEIEASNPYNKKHGFVYACRIQDLRKRIGMLPPFQVNAVLDI